MARDIPLAGYSGANENPRPTASFVFSSLSSVRSILLRASSGAGRMSEQHTIPADGGSSDRYAD